MFHSVILKDVDHAHGNLNKSTLQCGLEVLTNQFSMRYRENGFFSDWQDEWKRDEIE